MVARKENGIMVRVPSGTRMVLLRHAESVHNQKKNKARQQGKTVPIPFSGARGADLSAPGYAQAFLAGGFIQEKWLKGETADMIACSNLYRAERTELFLKRGGGIKARQTIYADVLDEQRLGERFVDLCQRAEKVLELILRNTEEPNRAQSFIVVSHAKMIIALRYLLEGLTLAVVERIFQAEGPPFPPHVGMTCYAERNGFLVREGKPYRLPSQLVASGRELFFRRISKDELRAICRLLKLKEEEVLSRYR